MAWHTKTLIGKDHAQNSNDAKQQQQWDGEYRRPYIRKVNYYEFMGEDGDEEQGWTRPAVTYGPLYRDRDSQMWIQRKRSVMRHIVTRSPTNINETVTAYIRAMQRVESQARALYIGDESVNQLPSNEFIWMMIKDGCFMLVCGLFALGGTKQLGFPQDDPMFGDQWNKEQIKLAIASMFYVGNQIPIVVLKELMKQNFFQKVINTGKWKQPMDLPRKTLFEFLLVPMLDAQSSQLSSLLEGISSPSMWFNSKANVHQPSDLLHGLWLLMRGPGISSSQADEVGDGDYYGDCPAVRSAKELREAGIFFKDNKETGARGIRFKKDMFNGILTLPPIIIDSDTRSLFWNLIHYEVTQQLGEYQREVSAYLQFMRELIRSPEDVKLLAAHGIILADPKGEEELPRILCKLPLTGVKENCNLGLVRGRIRNYSQPSKWEKLRNLISLVLLLTVVETIYTISGYYHKTN